MSKEIEDMKKLCMLLLCVVILWPAMASANDQSFSFNIPSFSGKSAGSTYYTALLESQKRPKDDRETKSTLEKFQENLERRLLSRLATDIVNQIFGPDAETSGSFSVGGLEVVFDTVDGDVVVRLTDGISTTEITVPGLD